MKTFNSEAIGDRVQTLYLNISNLIHKDQIADSGRGLRYTRKFDTAECRITLYESKRFLIRVQNLGGRVSAHTLCEEDLMCCLLRFLQEPCMARVMNFQTIDQRYPHDIELRLNKSDYQRLRDMLLAQYDRINALLVLNDGLYDDYWVDLNDLHYLWLKEQGRICVLGFHNPADAALYRLAFS